MTIPIFLSYSECDAIIASKPENKDLAAWFSDQACRMYRIKSDLAELKKEETRLRSQFKVRLAKIRRRRSEIRERCKHLFAYQYVETSNHRTYGKCNTCGDILEIST